MNKFHTKQQAETENISSSGIHYLYPQRQDRRPHKKRIVVGYAPAAICFFIRLPYYDWAI